MRCPYCGRAMYRCCCGSSNNYGCAHFLFDIFMLIITGGLWIIYIFVREMRRRRGC